MAGTILQMNQIGSIQTIWQEKRRKNFVVFSQTFRQYGMTARDSSPPLFSFHSSVSTTDNQRIFSCITLCVQDIKFRMSIANQSL
jgi:hypothetical protein